MFAWIRNLFKSYPQIILGNYTITAREDSFVITGLSCNCTFPNHVDIETCVVDELTITIKDRKLSVFCMNHIKITGFHNPEAITLNKIRRKKD